MINVLLHRIAVKPFDFNDFDEGRKRLKDLGWVVPEIDKEIRAKASVDIGVIHQIGPTAFKDFGVDIPVKIGDVVSYVRGAGKIIVSPFDKTDEVVVLNDEDIVAIFSKD